MPLVWLNNEFREESDASISVRDTGLLHAAGVFTTMRSYAGRVFRAAQHLQRLRNSCEALSIPFAYDDEGLIRAMQELLARNELTDARLRLTITRGHAQGNEQEGLRLVPTILLTAVPFEPYPAEYYQRGMTVILLDAQKLNPYDMQAGHKTLNYFSRLAALRSANANAAGEALWFNVHNYLESGSISNVFIVKKNVLVTAPTADELLDPAVAELTAYPKSAVLPGITRGAIFDIAREAKIGVTLASITVNDLLDADEVFLTNSVMEIMPVCRIERRVIGNDKPGTITKKLVKLLREMIAKETKTP
ncbi:MAG TPA: aminotransferase class IV [Tepidisphaeraceae bacterium]|nr:aminotransferase class IV [Tepidisphaeraceae bacterium]